MPAGRLRCKARSRQEGGRSGERFSRAVPGTSPRPRRTVEELLAAKGAPPLGPAEELSANFGVPDPELDEFLESYRAERQQNQS